MVKDTTNLTRAEVVERLKKFAAREPLDRRDLASGAGRASQWLPPPCQECGQALDNDNYGRTVDAYKSYVVQLRKQKLDASLIIPDFCQRCGLLLPAQAIQLEIKYPDQPEPFRIGLYHSDYLMLKA